MFVKLFKKEGLPPDWLRPVSVPSATLPPGSKPHPRAVYFQSQAVYFQSQAVYFQSRAVYFQSEAMHFHRQVVYVQSEAV